MNLIYVSDELIDSYKNFSWGTYHKRCACAIKQKLTKPLRTEINRLLSSFGGDEYKRNQWEFAFDVKQLIEYALLYGYYYGVKDNINLIPPSIVKAMVSHLNHERKVLVPYPGYSTLLGAVSTLNEDMDVTVAEGDGLEELYPGNLTAYDRLENIIERFDAIIYRPPLWVRSDIESIYNTTALLRPGGKLVTMVTSDVEWSPSNECVKFRKWADSQLCRSIQVDTMVWSRTSQISANIFILQKGTE